MARGFGDCPPLPKDVLKIDKGQTEVDTAFTHTVTQVLIIHNEFMAINIIMKCFQWVK